MMEQEYRREMDRVELSPDQRARIVQAMVEEPPRKQRRRWSCPRASVPALSRPWWRSRPGNSAGGHRCGC